MAGELPPGDPYRRPDGATDAEVEAAGKMSEAMEVIEDARGHLFAFHRLLGHADFTFEAAAGLLLALVPIYALGYVAGAWLLGRRILKPAASRFAAFLVGWAILRVVALIPIAGGLAWLVATVFGLGALIVAAWRARRPHPAAPAAPATGT